MWEVSSLISVWWVDSAYSAFIFICTQPLLLFTRQRCLLSDYQWRIRLRLWWCFLNFYWSVAYQGNRAFYHFFSKLSFIFELQIANDHARLCRGSLIHQISYLLFIGRLLLAHVSIRRLVNLILTIMSSLELKNHEPGATQPNGHLLETQPPPILGSANCRLLQSREPFFMY